MRRLVITCLLLSGLLAFGATAVPAQNLAEIEDSITAFTLENGLRFIVVERHDAPVFSYVSICKVGSVNEVPGITGLAHMFEHMAFKGTTVIGTTDYAKEKKALELVDAAYETLWLARLDNAPQAEIDAAEAAFAAAQDAAREFVVTNEFGGIVEQAGGTGLNASTQSDVTTYFYNLPSNKLELWAYLESERYINPVMREFYTERDVVMEERRMRTDSSPFGRLIEDFGCMAYKAHPYGQPTVGWMSDLNSFTRLDAIELYNQYYVPGNVVFVLVGDVDPVEVQGFAEEYFESWEVGPVPEPVRTVEPEQLGERRVTLVDPGQPILAIGYHKPDGLDADDAAFDVLTEILANGRSSRLHQRMVKDDKSAIAVGAFTGYPGVLYPGLFLAFAVPAKGYTAAQCEVTILEEIEKVQEGDISLEELDSAKTRIKANWMRQVRSNTGMANMLCTSEVILGSWEKGLQYPLDIDAVTLEDLQRISLEYLTAQNRTVGSVVTEEKGADDAS
jgi:predicted Zn-dependent peptidase